MKNLTKMAIVPAGLALTLLAFQNCGAVKNGSASSDQSSESSNPSTTAAGSMSGGTATQVSPTCVQRTAATVTKEPCGIVAQVSCLAGETVQTGGGIDGSNIALQNSAPILTNGVVTGWNVSWYDNSASYCAINSVADGTVASGDNPCFTDSIGEVLCGSASVICCKQ